jgi:hypothetical protein
MYQRPNSLTKDKRYNHTSAFDIRHSLFDIIAVEYRRPNAEFRAEMSNIRGINLDKIFETLAYEI